MKKGMVATILAAGLVFGSGVAGPGVVWAHTANEKTLYDDIEFSKAKEQIVYLRGINVIPAEEGAHLFKPTEPLTKKELKKWVDGFYGEPRLADGDGNATYADVNKAFFDGHASTENADKELTHEEFALYVGKYLTEKVDGKTLFEKAGDEPGPSGVVEKVTSATAGSGSTAYDVYKITVGGKEYPIGEHPKLLYAPTDLHAMEGKKLQSSWMHQGEIEILTAVQGQFDGMSPKAYEEHAHDHNSAAEEQKPFPWVPVVGGVLLVGLVGWLLIGKRRK